MKYLSKMPFSVGGTNQDAYGEGWDRIFGKKEDPEPESENWQFVTLEGVEKDEKPWKPSREDCPVCKGCGLVWIHTGPDEDDAHNCTTCEPPVTP